MNQKKIDQVDNRLSAFYSEVNLDSVSMPIYQSLVKEDRQYEDEILIAEGGMKTVSSVYDARADRRVAIAKPLNSLNDEQD